MSRRRTRNWSALLAVAGVVVACAVCGPDAMAQKNAGPPNALQGFSQNRDEPVKIRAASLELREKDKMATFTGDVYVLQGDTEMHCKQLVVFYEEETATQNVKTVKAADPGPGGDRQIRRIEAKGNVWWSISLAACRRWIRVGSRVCLNQDRKALPIRATLRRKATPRTKAIRRIKATPRIKDDARGRPRIAWPAKRLKALWDITSVAPHLIGKARMVSWN